MQANDLITQAEAARKHAYAPYSGYRVGAALLCSDGSVYTGCNVENSSYGLTNCAERTALFAAVAAGKTGFEAIAISADGDAVPFPCGACRQVLAEFCGPGFTIHVAGTDGLETLTLDELLPHRFDMGSSRERQ